VNVFELRQRLVDDYADYTRSFVAIRDERIRERVDTELEQGLLWPDPIVQLNPAFEPGGTIDDLVAEGLLHPRCAQIFRRNKTAESPEGESLRLHRHQREAIERTLMQGYRIRHPDTGFPVSAFRLHQFFSLGDTVYASLEHEDDRFTTTEEQQFVPGDRSRALYPLASCPECGQEYYTVRGAYRNR